MSSRMETQPQFFAIVTPNVAGLESGSPLENAKKENLILESRVSLVQFVQSGPDAPISARCVPELMHAPTSRMTP